MTAAHVYTLICDVADCDETLATMEARAEHARAVAAQAGWSHEIAPSDRGRAVRVDRCPKHTKAAARG